MIGAAVAASLGIFDRDACLDAGGRWITERGACEVPEGTTFVPIARRGGVWLTWGSVAAIATALVAWAYMRGSRPPESTMTDGASPSENADDSVLYVYVEDDGSARELTPDEREYLATEFMPGDSGRPYIKGYYRQRTPDGHLSGFLARTDLPRRIVVRPTPSADA